MKSAIQKCKSTSFKNHKQMPHKLNEWKISSQKFNVQRLFALELEGISAAAYTQHFEFLSLQTQIHAHVSLSVY